MNAYLPTHQALPDPEQVLAKACLRTADMLGLRGAALAQVLGLSEASVSRLMSGQRGINPASKEGELAALLIRLFRSLDALVGNDSRRRQIWFDSHNHALNGTPRQLIASAQGLVMAVAYLDSMRATL
jgi:hypothetical protein